MSETQLTSLQLKRRAYDKKYSLENPKKTWAKHARKDARKRALKKGVPFDLTVAYIVSIMTDTCPVFGTEFKWIGNGSIQPTSANIDRIDPAKGYVAGNLVIISSKANNIKSAYKSADLYKVADWLYEIEKG
jgi:hypothetical protein